MNCNISATKAVKAQRELEIKMAREAAKNEKAIAAILQQDEDEADIQ